MNWKKLVIVFAICSVTILGITTAAAGNNHSGTPTATLLASGLGDFLVGSTVGPDGALYIPDGAAGRIWRVDPQTGVATTFASGLPQRVVPGDLGGPVDIAFIKDVAYVLVTLVGSDYGGNADVGIYRMDDPDSFTVISEIGSWSIANPSNSLVMVPSGVQYAMQPYKDGFLVTDAHHNRILQVSLDGEISEVIAFSDVVPTGLELSGNEVFLAEAGPIPHNPEDGIVVSFNAKSPSAVELASGASMIVDVEFGLGRALYALSQGTWPAGSYEGAPAIPNTGALVKVNKDGTFTIMLKDLDRPTSLEFIKNTAYVITLTGEIWKIEGLPHPGFNSGQVKGR